MYLVGSVSLLSLEESATIVYTFCSLKSSDSVQRLLFLTAYLAHHASRHNPRFTITEINTDLFRRSRQMRDVCSQLQGVLSKKFAGGFYMADTIEALQCVIS